MTDCKRNRNTEVHYSQVLKEGHGKPQGATWGDQGRVGRERQELGHTPVLGSVVHCFGASRLGLDWSTQTRKVGLVKPPKGGSHQMNTQGPQV